MTFKDYQRLSKTIKDYHRLSQTIIDYRGLSQTIVDYRCIVDYRRLSQTTDDYKRLLKTIEDFLSLSKTIKKIKVYFQLIECLMKIIFQESLHSFLGSLKSPSKSLIRVYHRSSSYSHERLIKVSSRSHKLAMHGWLEHSCYMAEQQQYFWVGHLRKISCFLCATMLSSSHSISKKEEDVSLFFFSLM